MAKRLGEILIDAKVITQEQLDHALTVQRGDGRKLGHLLAELKMVTETQLTQALGRQLAVPWVTLYHVEFSRGLLNFVPKEVAERYMLVPVHVRKTKKGGEELFVAMDDPTNEAALAEVSKLAGIPVKPMIACPSDIRDAIRVYYGGGAPTPAPTPKPSTQATPQPKPQKPPPPPNSRGSLPDAAEAAGGAPPGPERNEVPTQPEIAALAGVPAVPESMPPDSIEPMSEDHPNSETEIESTETEVDAKPRRGKMVALTLLDGTTIKIPASGQKRASAPEGEGGGAEVKNDTLTARDLISALRAVAYGADASEILGEKPPGWEAMFAALLSLMLKKGLIADWEFIEEFRKI